MNMSEYINENAHLDSAAEVPEKPQYTHNVTISDTARGVRLSVKVSADNFKDARYEAVDLYIKVQQDLQIQGIPLAPVELKNGVKP